MFFWNNKHKKLREFDDVVPFDSITREYYTENADGSITLLNPSYLTPEKIQHLLEQIQQISHENRTQIGRKSVQNRTQIGAKSGKNQTETEKQGRKINPKSFDNLKPKAPKTTSQYMREYADVVKMLRNFKFVLRHFKRPHYMFINKIPYKVSRYFGVYSGTGKPVHSDFLIRTMVGVMQRRWWFRTKVYSGIVGMLCGVGIVAHLYFRPTLLQSGSPITSTLQNVQLATMSWNLYKANKYHVIAGSYTERNKAENIPYKLHVIASDNKYRVCVYCANSKNEATLQAQMYEDSWILTQ